MNCNYLKVFNPEFYDSCCYQDLKSKLLISYFLH